MRSIDLFSGAGGLSLGLEQAGFDTVLAVEMNQDACNTYSALFPHCDLKAASIEELSFAQYAGKVELLAGGPPCQPFSSGGKRLAQNDVRDMLPQYLRALTEIRPPLFLMENVPGLAREGRATYLSSFMGEFELLGYEVTWGIVNASDYGVPQKRRRLVIVGSKIGPFTFPEKTHGPEGKKPYEKSGTFLDKYQIIGFPNPSKVVYAKNPDLRPSPYDGHLFNGGGRAINLNGLCPTILASSGGNKTHFVDSLDEVPRYHAELLQGHPPREGILPGGRRLTVEECALIQTFPPGTRFCGSRSSQYRQVGNAVPPLLARRIGESLTSLLTGAYSEAS